MRGSHLMDVKRSIPRRLLRDWIVVRVTKKGWCDLGGGRTKWISGARSLCPQCGDMGMPCYHWCDARAAVLVLTSLFLVSFWAPNIQCHGLNLPALVSEYFGVMRCPQRRRCEHMQGQ